MKEMRRTMRSVRLNIRLKRVIPLWAGTIQDLVTAQVFSDKLLLRLISFVIGRIFGGFYFKERRIGFNLNFDLSVIRH